MEKNLNRTTERNVKNPSVMLGLMNSRLNKSYGRLILYMVTASRQLHAERCKSTNMPTWEEWIVKWQHLQKWHN